MLVTAASSKAIEQAMGMVRRGGTIVLNGLPPGTIPLNIFEMVLNAITVRGSIVGTRRDLHDALELAAGGRIKTIVEPDKLENINAIFDRMHKGQIEGRIVLNLAS